MKLQRTCNVRGRSDAVLLAPVCRPFGSLKAFHEPALTRPTDTLSHPLRRRDSAASRMGEGRGEGRVWRFKVPMHARKQKEAAHEPPWSGGHPARLGAVASSPAERASKQPMRAETHGFHFGRQGAGPLRRAGCLPPRFKCARRDKGPVWSLLVAVSLLCACVNLRAQPGSTVDFGNNRACLVTNELTVNPVTATDGIKAALYCAAPGSSGFVPIGAAVTVGAPLSGLFVGGTRTLIGMPGGQTYQFRVRAWETSFGSTYEAARANTTPQNGRLALFGESSIIQATAGDPAADPPTPPGSLTAGGLSGFAVRPNTIPPIVTTLPASEVVSIGTNTVATLNGAVCPNGLGTVAWFDWGTGTNYGQTTAATNVGTGWVTLSVSNTLTGLTAGLSYHCRLVASNSAWLAQGANEVFWSAGIILSGVELRGDGAFHFLFTNTPGASFTVVASTNVALPSSDWTALAPAIEGPAGEFHFTDVAATNYATRFYRLSWP
jgi:hypothetical protein